MTESLFAILEDIMPNLSQPVNSQTKPLSLIASKSLQIFPWELILNEPLIRHFSYEDFIGESKKRTKNDQLSTAYEDYIPKYISFYYSGLDKTFIQVEEQRRSWLIEDTFHYMNLQLQSPSYLPYWRSSLTLPFHSTAVKYGKKIHGHKKRYKYISWIDLSLVIDNQSITEMTQQTIQPNEFGIFLLSYTDLIESNSTLMSLMQNFKESPFLFVPPYKMKSVASKLMKIQEELLKPIAKTKMSTPSIGKYQFLMNALQMVQSECQVPVTIFNAPQKI